MIEPIAYPTDSAGWLSFVTEHFDERLARVRSLAATLTDGAERSAGEALQVWNDLQIDLHATMSQSSALSEVHPDAAVRAAAEDRFAAAEALSNELMSDAALAGAFSSLDARGLDEEAARVLDHLLRDFRRGGAGLERAQREKAQQLAEKDTELSLAFSRNIREGRREITVDAGDLEGLPDDFLAEHPADAEGRVTLSTDATDFLPVISYAHNRQVRTALARARADLAWPANDAVLAELLQVRRERAQVLGYGNWCDYETEDRMATSSARVAEFLVEVDEASAAAAGAEYDLLLERLRRDVPDAESVTAADQQYLLTRMHEENFSVDAQQVRSYFDYDRVLAGVLRITGQLFDIVYEQVDVPTWHEDVRSYNVVRDGERIGRIHLDMHPREGKYNHAACFPIAPGITGRMLPEAALVCNFPRGLMEHDQVTTFFHEFGHLVHDILGGDQRWAAFSGVATEWDFVEAPSQMLEEWAWDAEVLQTFAMNEQGQPIPADLVDKMRTADAFGRALLVRTQLGHARVSYHLHVDVPDDLAAATQHWYDASTRVTRLPDTHSYAGFGHLTGYGSCYYTYQWSLVIARDLLTGFVAGLMHPESAARYRREILEPGGSRDAADLVESFLGRPFTVDAYRTWLTPTPSQ
ncbi:M3 family metallopeptidase [Microbacterium sp. YY-01]|uniref:M3 family metallopeptidase n=1 Tax=Microbacterium sp. YY-01 TaxID=3421634 RepID=UPI003D171222